MYVAYCKHLCLHVGLHGRDIFMILKLVSALFTFSVNRLLASLLGAGDGRLLPVDLLAGLCAKL